MLRYFVVTILIYLIGVCSSIASVQVVCDITPQIWELSPPPQEINKTNNLRTQTGSFYFASGRFIQIRGRILDARCVPVVGASVIIWHASADIKSSQAKAFLRDGEFVGSGTATTDNLGNFAFYTVMPAHSPSGVPYVNFRVEHRDFSATETKMFFPRYQNNKDQDFRNIKDQYQKNLLLAKLTNISRRAVEDDVCGGISSNDADNEEEVYEFNITLNMYNKYLKY